MAMDQMYTDALRELEQLKIAHAALVISKDALVEERDDLERKLSMECDRWKLLAEECNKVESERDRLKEALEACKASLIDAGREHSPAVAKARAALEECKS